jgi:hypothetical protein
VSQVIRNGSGDSAMEFNGDTNASFDAGISKELHDQVRRLLAPCSAEQQWQVICHLVRDLLGDEPQEEVPLSEPEGIVYAFIVPVKKRFELVERGAEEWAALETSVGGDIGSTIPADVVIGVLEASDSSADVANRLERLSMSTR